MIHCPWYDPRLLSLFILFVSGTRVPCISVQRFCQYTILIILFSLYFPSSSSFLDKSVPVPFQREGTQFPSHIPFPCPSRGTSSFSYMTPGLVSIHWLIYSLTSHGVRLCHSLSSLVPNPYLPTRLSLRTCDMTSESDMDCLYPSVKVVFSLRVSLKSKCS